MLMSNSQLRALVTAGGPLVIDASSMTLPALRLLAAEAAKAKVPLTLRQVGRITPEHLKQLIAAAPGLVVIDLT